MTVFFRLCMIVDFHVISLDSDTFLWSEMSWAAWPWGKNNCGKVEHRVYEVAANEPRSTIFHLRELYHTKRTNERDLVGFLGGEEILNVCQQWGIPCINLSLYDCPPFDAWLFGIDVTEGTNDYHKLLVEDLMQWLLKTLTMLKLSCVTNDMSKMDIDRKCK